MTVFIPPCVNIVCYVCVIRGVGEDNAVQRRRQEELLNPCAAGPGWPEGRAGAGCHSDRTIVSRLSQVTAAVFPNGDLLLGQTQCLGNCAR